MSIDPLEAAWPRAKLDRAELDRAELDRARAERGRAEARAAVAEERIRVLTGKLIQADREVDSLRESLRQKGAALSAVRRERDNYRDASTVQAAVIKEIHGEVTLARKDAAMSRQQLDETKQKNRALLDQLAGSMRQADALREQAANCQSWKDALAEAERVNATMRLANELLNDWGIAKAAELRAAQALLSKGSISIRSADGLDVTFDFSPPGPAL